MLTYLDHEQLEPQTLLIEHLGALEQAVWIDMLSPSKEEEHQIEQCINLNVPSRAEMVEIELSSRLYKEDGTLFMTATMIAYSDSNTPKLDPVTFVLTSNQLITIRYIEPLSFKLFILHLKKLDIARRDATTLLIELLDASVDRLADILELVGTRLDTYSQTIFQGNAPAVKLDYRQLMQQIGSNGDLNTKARESLISFNRLISFFEQTADARIDNEGKMRLKSLHKDIVSLSDHADFLSNKVNFLLDATLGMVSIEQNNIIKIFSVAAVIFLPPTLIASIYGMNFDAMPELSWKYGYLVSLSLMSLGAWLPYKYFKHKKWL